MKKVKILGKLHWCKRFGLKVNFKVPFESLVKLQFLNL